MLSASEPRCTPPPWCDAAGDKCQSASLPPRRFCQIASSRRRYTAATIISATTSAAATAPTTSAAICAGVSERGLGGAAAPGSPQMSQCQSAPLPAGMWVHVERSIVHHGPVGLRGARRRSGGSGGL
jgi:hypothetical protein